MLADIAPQKAMAESHSTACCWGTSAAIRTGSRMVRNGT